MRIPTSRAHDSLRQVVRMRSTAYDLTRPNSESTGRFGESEDSEATVGGVDMWLFDPQEVNIDTQYGDRLGGDLQGLALPAADVVVHDRVDHGTDSYEVERIMHLPNEQNQQLKIFSLQRRTNE